MSDEPGKVHAVFDGIEEEDNRLPGWWLGILYTTMLFGFGYWFVFHTTHSVQSTREQYAVEAAAKAKALAAANPVSDDSLLALSKQQAALDDGKKTFTTICIACHGPDGRGTVGPNLTDKYWIHSGQPSRIFQAVTGGFPDKGMPPWGPVLGVEKTRNVVAFVLTIKNTNVAGGKPPQGNPEDGIGPPAPGPQAVPAAPGPPAAPAEPGKETGQAEPGKAAAEPAKEVAPAEAGKP